jgi:hypothetical protein
VNRALSAVVTIVRSVECRLVWFDGVDREIAAKARSATATRIFSLTPVFVGAALLPSEPPHSLEF